jgi:hypothetical protein
MTQKFINGHGMGPVYVKIRLRYDRILGNPIEITRS